MPPGFWWRAVDLVSEQHVGEDRTLDEAERALAAAVVLEDLGAGDVGGHQVGGELHAFEAEVEHVAEGADEQCLGESWHPHQQGVSAAEDGDEHLFDHLILADDDLGELSAHALVGVAEFLHQLGIAGGCCLGLGRARDALGRRGACGAGRLFEVEADGRGADGDDIAILQRAGFGLCAIEHGAVGTLQVVDPPLAFFEKDHGVGARDFGVEDLHVGRVVAAQGQPGFWDLV